MRAIPTVDDREDLRLMRDVDVIVLTLGKLIGPQVDLAQEATGRMCA